MMKQPIVPLEMPKTGMQHFKQRKRPITRCIASLQSSSYTVFKQKIGEDFL